VCVPRRDTTSKSAIGLLYEVSLYIETFSVESTFECY
jgi:hypothetical protein